MVGVDFSDVEGAVTFDEDDAFAQAEIDIFDVGIIDELVEHLVDDAWRQYDESACAEIELDEDFAQRFCNLVHHGGWRRVLRPDVQGVLPAWTIEKGEVEVVLRASLTVPVLGYDCARRLQAGHVRPGGDAADGCVVQLPPDRPELLEGLRHERGLSYDQPSFALTEHEQKPTVWSILLHGVFPFVRHLVVGAMKHPSKQVSFVKMEDCFY